jgi:hypothetical protein
MACFVPLNEGLDVLSVDEHFPAYLDKGQAARPYLRAPEPFSGAELIDQFFDGKKTLSGRCLMFVW